MKGIQKVLDLLEALARKRGQMELSKYMADRLYSCFVTKVEEPEQFSFINAGDRFAGQWFCPGCGVLMPEEEPALVNCPQCRRNIERYLHQLTITTDLMTFPSLSSCLSVKTLPWSNAFCN
jgi:rubrerythrin